ncbi:MAG TPA: MerR family DNA-binding transcriptional regulator [Sporichthyaceae bacterium]|jgi:hypothetical protein|nr:MerR family DNA-binding transcriptional regulator [Sporichthyaceae bacterium]
MTPPWQPAGSTAAGATPLARPFKVDVKTVTPRPDAGPALSSIRALGGHRRFPHGEILAVLHSSTSTRHEPVPTAS